MVMTSEERRESMKAARKRFAERRPEKVREYSLDYYYRNKDLANHRRCLRKYGLTVEQYDAILLSQEGRCAICRVDKCKSGKRFAVDHDHDSGKVRGILCNNCNRALGLFGDSADNLTAAASYLRERSDQ